MVEKRVISRAETTAYLCALMVNFVDQMGPYFVGPVLVTYGQWIGASLSTIAAFQTARGLSAMLSNVWMPMLSDRIGRKWVAFLSVLGVTLGYFIQAMAFVFRDPDNLKDWGPPCICFIIGRFVTGSFAGMMPVLQAYVTELSAPEPELITQRLVVMQIAATVGGMVLSPISGVIAQFGMQVPFFVVTAVGTVSIFLVPIYFQEVVDVRGPPEEPEQNSQAKETKVQEAETHDAQQGSGEARDAPLLDPIDVESASFAAREAERKRGSPFCDVVVGSMFCAYFCLMIMINGGSIFLTPILFQQPSFEIPGYDENPDIHPSEFFQQNVSKWVGFSNIPLTFLQVAVAIFLFVPVTTKFGEVPTLFTMGIVGACSFPMVYLIGDKVWKVAFIFAFLGMSFGFLTPALGPLAARYGRALYPKQMALVQGIPMAGLQLSNALAQNILAPIVGDPTDAETIDDHLRNAYFFVGGVAVLFTFLFSIAAVVANRRIKEHERLTGGALSAGGNKFDDTLAQSTLKRSAASFGEGTGSFGPATPVLRRAISERSVARKRAKDLAAAEAASQSLQPTQTAGGDGS